ncbi:antitoxin Xre/MbcA/ParS toxin-binding domain-containing protein [uncultured Arcticibacterium sp.]|uniref:type II RES/Xre toxin-antitoxin system antitoxin n=1 Tax=uncultured Arcticibacterium sp. TaxID=2173042 RepID=UPI0030F80033
MEKTLLKRDSNELKTFIKHFERGKGIKATEVTYSRFLSDKLLVAKAVKRGVPTVLFSEIKSNSPFNDIQWSAFLDINIRTLQRYRKEEGHVFKQIQSEKIFELAEVVDLGNKVFDSPEDFTIWLNTPSLALGKNKPIDLLDTSYGKDIVMAELNRIEYGVFV